MDLSLVIPCYNEEPHLRDSVRELCAVLDGTRLDYEIVFVDDVSPDGTRAVIREICASTPRCRFVFHEQNRGRGGAFKTGFNATTGRVTGFIDVDLEVGAHYIPPLVDRIQRHGCDVATGHRHYLTRQTHALHRIVLSLGYRLLLRMALGLAVKDSETGCKFFRRDTAAPAVLGSESDGWFFDTEVMARADLAELRICELPVVFVRRWDKQSTVRLWRDIRAYLVSLHRFRARIGLSYLGKSPVYWSGRGFDLVMRALYGKQLDATYRAVAERVPEGASVVDVCCGTARLYRDHLAARRSEYLGLDFNTHFVFHVRKRGVHARFFDVLKDRVPPADCVTMLSSLYHFRRQAADVVGRMRAAARRRVIVSEPVRNLSGRRTPLSRLAARLSNPGVGDYAERFDLEEFRALAHSLGASEFSYREGDHNAVAVFPPATPSDA